MLDCLITEVRFNDRKIIKWKYYEIPNIYYFLCEITHIPIVKIVKI